MSDSRATTEPTEARTSLPARFVGGTRDYLGGSAGRNIGLILALIVLIIVGGVLAGDRFINIENALIILRLASVSAVVAVGMTFVITSGGIDLSIGSILGLATVVATIAPVQVAAGQVGWWLMAIVAVAVGAGAGLVNGAVIAYGKVVPFIATLAMLVAARGLAELISEKKTLVVDGVFVNGLSVKTGLVEFFRGSPLGVSWLVWCAVIVAVVGWLLLNRTTFGRRTVAIGGNEEAARLAGIKVKRHTVYIYVLSGVTAGIAAIMLVARTTAGSSTNGTLYELDAIAAVVVGGTLLIGGRGTITGTILGVLIFSILLNIFTQINVPNSIQDVSKGLIIIAAVLLQQRFAVRRNNVKPKL
jgi:ribose transport system permease protein